jgi:uncharacterized protein
MQKENTWKERLRKIIIWMIAIYIFLMAGFYFSQHLFFFHPTALPADYQFQFAQKFKEQPIQPDENTVTDIVQFLPDDSAKGVVLYFHGNRDNIERYAPYSKIFTSQGYECWMIDYPGFGRSTGKLTTESMKLQAMQFYLLARSKFKREQVIIYGKSMGTGPACYLASTRDCRLLLLETPYYSLSSLASRFAPFLPVSWLINVDFKNGEYLQNVTAPVIAFHGTEDATIPIDNAERLKQVLKKGDRFISIEGGKHNGLTESTEYKQVVDSLL